jgi:DNA replication and repair protein RecF
MRFRGASFYNFRNLVSARVEWDPGVNLLIGPNGAGKSGILEALSVVSGWGPFEGTTASLACWDRPDSGAAVRVRAEGEEEGEAAARIGRGAVLAWNGRRTGASAMRERLPSLAFLPNQTALVEGGASARRRLLDQIGALLFAPYAQRLHEWRRIVRQRTVLLRRSGGDASREESLARHLRALAEPQAVWLWRARSQAAVRLEEALIPLGRLTGCPLRIRFVRGGGGFEEEPESDWRVASAARAREEVRAGIPLVGPHRDDLLLTVEDRPAARALSRGRRRRVAAALMLAAAGAVSRSLSRDPVLLFDEVAAELDDEGREALFGALRESRLQVFAATAEEGFRFPGAFRVRVEGGKIAPCS